MTYQDQIKSPKWQKKRLSIMENYDFKCANCGSAESQLHVHHLVYKKNKKIWDYENSDLRCYCDKCHKLTHKLTDEILQASAALESCTTIACKYAIMGYIDSLTIYYPREDYKNVFEYMDGYKCGFSYYYPDQKIAEDK